MNRNMIQINEEFFDHAIRRCARDDVIDCKRYISTDKEDKNWIKNLLEGKRFKFSRNSYAQLVELDDSEYICLINSKCEPPHHIENFEYIDVNPGLFTLLGSWDLLHFADGVHSSEIINEVLQDTEMIEGYTGHIYDEIRDKFVDILCYKVSMFESDVKANSDSRFFHWAVLNLILQLSVFHNNNYDAETLQVWDKLVYEQSFEKTNYRSVLLSYCAMTWDVSYLYLYQCLEDAFAENAVASLHSQLGLGLEDVSLLELSGLLYEELQWQPRDKDAIKSLLKRVDATSDIYAIIKELANDMDPANWIYKTRNSIVHETRDLHIPFDDDVAWNLAITCLIKLSLES